MGELWRDGAGIGDVSLPAHLAASSALFTGQFLNQKGPGGPH